MDESTVGQYVINKRILDRKFDSKSRSDVLYSWRSTLNIEEVFSLRSRRVLSRNQAKSEIYDLPAFPPSPSHPFLFLSGYRKRQNLTKREMISVTRFKPLLNLILWENTINANHPWELFHKCSTAIEKYIEHKNFLKNFHFCIIC